MNENSSQTIKEISEDNEIKNSSVFIKDDKGGWVIRENWIAFKPLKLDPKLGQSK